MKVDSTTWCPENNQAGKYLAQMLTKMNDEKLVQKVGTYFHRFNRRMKALNVLDKSMRTFYLQMLLKQTEKEINANFKYETVRTLMLNIIRAFYRIELNKCNIKSKS